MSWKNPLGTRNSEAPPVSLKNEGPRSRSLLVAAMALIVGAVVVVWWPTRALGFARDDWDWLAFFLPRRPLVDYLLWRLGGGFFRPATNLYILAIARSGSPASAQAVGLLLHLCTSGLLWVILRRLTGRPWLALAGTAVFALSVAHFQARWWICSHSDLLAAVFALVALYAADRALTGRPPYWAVSIGCAWLAMSAKEWGVLTPLLLTGACIFRWSQPQHRPRGAKLGPALALAVCLVGAVLFIAFEVQGRNPSGYALIVAEQPAVSWPRLVRGLYLVLYCISPEQYAGMALEGTPKPLLGLLLVIAAVAVLAVIVCVCRCREAWGFAAFALAVVWVHSVAFAPRFSYAPLLALVLLVGTLARKSCLHPRASCLLASLLIAWGGYHVLLNLYAPQPVSWRVQALQVTSRDAWHANRGVGYYPATVLRLDDLGTSPGWFIGLKNMGALRGPAYPYYYY